MLFRTIRQAIRSIREGGDDAKALTAQPKFLATMDFVERLPQPRQEAIAQWVELSLMTELAAKCRQNLPAHCQQDRDYLQYVDSRALRDLAENYLSAARRHKISLDGASEGEDMAVAAIQLIGYYLLSRSWQDLGHSLNIDAPGFGAPMIRLTIEKRIATFIRRHGRSLPRSC